MQTFLLDKSHRTTANLLDYRRLGKQRLEAVQLMDVLLRKAEILHDNKTGWNNHVAVDYWYSTQGNWLPALIQYTDVMIAEWINRGYKNTLSTKKWKTIVRLYPELFKFDNPPWMSNADAIIESHRARCLQKDKVYYANKFIECKIIIPSEWEIMEYVWMRPTAAQLKKKLNATQ